MNEFRLDLYLEQIEIAAHRTMEFVGHQTRDEFLADVKTQHAVAMSIAVMGEAATKIFNLYPDFVANSPDINWREIRGMRHHIVHVYFSIDHDVVWQTVQNDLPVLVRKIARLRSDLSAARR